MRIHRAVAVIGVVVAAALTPAARAQVPVRQGFTPVPVSTTIRVQTTVTVPDRGSVLLDGVDVSRLSPAARARAGIAIVPQGRQLFPRLNVLDNMRVMAELLRLPSSSVDEAIDRFPILRERERQCELARRSAARRRARAKTGPR